MKSISGEEHTVRMRRDEKEIKDLESINNIMKDATVCRIAICEDNYPYIIPMNFGYEDNYLYLHSALSGKKIDILKKNNNVCFEVDTKAKLITNDNPCKWTMHYNSVIGFGNAEFVENLDEKKHCLNIVMKNYSGRSDFDFPDNAINSIAIIKVKIEKITGKRSGY